MAEVHDMQTKTAFCPEDPFYHTKLIELLERARRCRTIDVKVEEGQEAAETNLNCNEKTIQAAKCSYQRGNGVTLIIIPYHIYI